jgi:hypothetical protein
MGATLRARREAARTGEKESGAFSGVSQPANQPKRPVALEKRLVMELARRLGVPTPIGDFIDDSVDQADYTYLTARLARND